MAKVRTECNKVASLSVFQVPVSKSMKLEEFEQTQAQVSTQVGANIKIQQFRESILKYDERVHMNRQRVLTWKFHGRPSRSSLTINALRV